MIKYGIADKRQCNEMARVMANAFCQYPLYTNVFLDKFDTNDEFMDFMTGYFQLAIKANMKSNLCYVATIGDKIVAAAVLQLPKYKDMTFDEYYSCGGATLELVCGKERLVQVLKAADGGHLACSEKYTQAYNLELLAVDSDFQGQGIGSKLLCNCIIDDIKLLGGDELTLATNTQKDREFYQKIGFSEFEAMEVNCRGTVVNTWCYYKKL